MDARVVLGTVDEAEIGRGFLIAVAGSVGYRNMRSLRAYMNFRRGIFTEFGVTRDVFLGVAIVGGGSLGNRAYKRKGLWRRALKK